MDVKIKEFFDSVGTFFSGGDNLPWCDGDIIAGCEKEVAEAGAEESKNASLMRLSWALVHSRRPEDVNRGIAMIEASLNSDSSPLQMREKLFLLAVGHYRNGDYPRSRQLLERCLELHDEITFHKSKDGMPKLRFASYIEVLQAFMLLYLIYDNWTLSTINFRMALQIISGLFFKLLCD